MEDNAAALLHMKSGAVGTIMSSWATRVRRDDLFTIQIDGTEGSAVARLRRCHAQRAGDTPEIKGFRMGAGRDIMDVSVDYFDDWREVPDVSAYKNPYRTGWENFIAHVRADAIFMTMEDAAREARRRLSG